MKLYRRRRLLSLVYTPGIPQRGGVALEYILVTTFTLATTLAALGYLKRVLKDRFAELEETASSSEIDDSFWNP